MLLLVFGSLICLNIEYYRFSDNGVAKKVNFRQCKDKDVIIMNSSNFRYHIFIDDFTWDFFRGNNLSIDLESNSFVVVKNVLPGKYILVIERVFDIKRVASDFEKVCRSLGKDIDPDQVTVKIDIFRVSDKMDFCGRSVNQIFDAHEVFENNKK